MKYTANYNLCKPDYDDTIDVDFLNKNMDVLDNQLNGLDYVQNVNTTDNGLTFIKRNGDTIPVSLNYLPITGGNLTGDLTVKGKEPLYVLDIQKTTADNGLKVKSVKYSDGRLHQFIITPTDVEIVTVTYPIPFKDTKDVTVSVGYIAPKGAGSVNFGFYTPNKFTNTGCSFNVVSVINYTYVIRGYWK